MRSPTAATGGSARPRWSAWGPPRRARRRRAWASSSATSVTCRRRYLSGSVSMSRLILGVDVGGTSTAAGVVTADGDVIGWQSAPTHGGGDPLRTMTALIEGVRQPVGYRADTIDAVGVGVPGPVDAARGRIGEPVTHVPALARRALAAELGARLRLPVFVYNDVNALALGEWMCGAGRGKRSLVVLAAGIGIGAGIVLDGRIVRGA